MDAPESFKAQWESVMRQVGPLADSHRDEWALFVGAWHGVGIRAIVAKEDSDFFTRSAQEDSAPLTEGRVRQEKALFSFFSSALSAVECIYFGCYWLAAVIKPNEFKKIHVSPQNVVKTFKSSLGSLPLCTVLEDTLKTTEYQSIEDIRNALSHRGILPRAFTAGNTTARLPSNPGAKTARADWKFDYEISERGTTEICAWLMRTLEELVEATESFCSTVVASSQVSRAQPSA